jgi:pyruvate/2-oxoglutarate dehydrogenase complex dihydrolipoamide acyltransferase (E2) component
MTHKIIAFPRSRGLAVASLQVAVKRHIVPLIFEADVTVPRRILKETCGADGRPLSFTAYVIACQARAMRVNPLLQGYRIPFNRMVTFQEVDVATYVEHRSGGMVTLHVVRDADTRPVRAISDEIRAARESDNLWGRLEKAYGLVSHLPRFLQVLIFHLLTLNPHWIRQFYGTTQTSSFGMFGKHVKWGIGLLYGHTMGTWVGGVAQKALVVDGSIAIRDCLHVAVSIDHDIIDAEPIVQFISAFVDLLQSGALLEGEAA